MVDFSFFRSRAKPGICDDVDGICFPHRGTSFTAIKERLKNVLVGYIVYLAILSPVHFLFGVGVGGIDVGTKYVALFMSLSVLLVLFFIPGIGVLMAASYNTVTVELILLLGLTRNFWIDVMMIAAINIVGVISQVMLMTWLLVNVVSSRVKSSKSLQ